jgi:hypothetical protein
MLLAIVLAAVASSDYPPPAYKLMRKEDSPHHSFTVETYLGEDGTAVWLRDQAGHTLTYGHAMQIPLSRTFTSRRTYSRLIADYLCR